MRQVLFKKGKVVVVGDVGLKIERLPWYEKEIDLRISTSYGPGRGDIKYEHEGIDYPYAYVRWTENRNMQAYLELLAEKKINFSSLVGGRYSLEDAALAYEALNSSKKPLAVLLSYPASILEDKKAETFIYLPSIDQRKDIIDGKIETGIIGLGSFAQVVHLPNLLKLKNLFHLRGICTSDQVKAKYFGKKYQAEIAATDYKEILKDPKINLVIITTRHNLHAQIVKDALMAGKNVFVEKPLCLNMAELEEILATLKEVNKNGNYPVLAVGFNRRFSPLAKKAKEIISGRRNPLLIYYRVNDTYLPPNHWVNTAEGGGRILGNACHMFDLFQYFIGSPVKEVKILTIETQGTFYLPTDNFSALLKFKDGSMSNLLYTTEGSEQLPKEYLEIYSEGRVLILNDFKELKTFGLREGMKTGRTAKGHLEELKTLGECLKQKKWPIPLEEIIETTKISFEIDRQVREKEL
jgi:predicted dehydrogenase